MQAVGQQIVRTMREFEGRFPLDDSMGEEVSEVAIKCNLSQTDDDAEVLEVSDLGIEMRRAVANLLRGGFVSRRRTANYGGDPCLPEFEAIFAAGCLRLIGKAGLVEDRIHKVTRTVACEGSAGPVGAVSAGSQAQDENSGPRIAEARNRACPVGLIPIGPAFGLPNSLAVGAKTRALLTRDNPLMNLKNIYRQLNSRTAFHDISW
jgi:hypothetical protein